MPGFSSPRLPSSWRSPALSTFGNRSTRPGVTTPCSPPPSRRASSRPRPSSPPRSPCIRTPRPSPLPPPSPPAAPARPCCACLLFRPEEGEEEVNAIWIPTSQLTWLPDKRKINGYTSQKVVISEWFLKKEGLI